MLAMQRAEIVGGLGGGHPLQDAIPHLDQSNVNTALGANSCGFQPDIAAPNDQCALPLDHMWCHSIHIPKATHHEDTAKIPANSTGQAARVRPGGQSKLIIGNDLLPQREGLGRSINRRHCCAKTQGNIVLGIEAFGT